MLALRLLHEEGLVGGRSLQGGRAGPSGPGKEDPRKTRPLTLGEVSETLNPKNFSPNPKP